MQEAQLFRLFEFIEQLWEPAITGASQPDGIAPAEANEAATQLFEAISWLQLGVELECYPAVEANAVIQHQRPRLRQIFNVNGAAVEGAIPPRLFYSLKGLLSGGADLNALDSFTERSKLIPYFEAAIALAANMNSDKLIALFRGALVGSESFSEKYLLDVISADLVAELYCGVDGIEVASAEGAAAGFLRTIEKILLWNQLFTTLRSDQDIDSAERAGVLRRLGQITYWRLNLNTESVRTRFELEADLVSGFARAVIAEAGLEISTETPELFSAAVKKLEQDWLRDHPYQLYIGHTA